MTTPRSTYRFSNILLLLVLIELLFWGALVGAYYTIRNFDPSLSFHNKWLLPFLAVLPIAAIVFLISLSRRNRAFKRLADNALLRNLAPGLAPGRTVFKFILWRLAAGLLLVALIDPKVGSRIEEVETRGVDLMVAIDVSNSMLAEDLKPNRLATAKRAVQQLINDLGGNRIGLVIFAGDAYVQLPITADIQSAKIFLDAINTNSVPYQGTNLGAAIDLCVESFDPKSEAGKAVIVITDGENHEEQGVEAAARAAKEGIEVHAIGVGAKGGAPIPQYNSRGQRTGFKTDAQGNTIVTALNEQSLVEIVSAGNGVFIRAAAGAVNISPIADVLDKMEKGELGTATFTDYEHRFRIFALAGIFLLITEGLIRERKQHRKIRIA